MKKIILYLMCISGCSFAQDVFLLNAIPSDFGKTPRTPDQISSSKVLTNIVKANAQIRGLSLAYTNLNSGDIWYDLYDDMKIYAVNVEAKTYLGSWPIKTQVCSENDEECDSPWWNGRWSDQEFIEPEVKERFVNYELDNSFKISYAEEDRYQRACFELNVLRYGDIESDGKNELVIMTNSSMILFSTEKKKTIFSYFHNNSDWINWSELVDMGLLLDDTKSHPQYGSIRLVREAKTTDNAFRDYGKIYQGHFSDNTSYDILVWRKLYISLWRSDSIKGFEKIRDTYIHYKLIDGEYQKQPTSTDTIKGWLAEKNLTWQKGYPSKSECPGQEGQLIPEMHDPLLNDPDVLIGLQ